MPASETLIHGVLALKWSRSVCLASRLATSIAKAHLLLNVDNDVTFELKD